MDELRRLVENAQKLVRQGYYRADRISRRAPSLLAALRTSYPPSDVIAELKFASPTRRSGKSREDFVPLLEQVVAAKPLGLSVLAEPNIFGGSLEFVRTAAATRLPVLMKDIVVDASQIKAAAAVGASAVLVIQSLFSRGLLEGSSQTLIDSAHRNDLDVILEVHTNPEFDEAVLTDADIVGINNRDLRTMAVDLSTTAGLLSARRKDRPVIAMSGIETRAQVDEMRRAGADAVLVGTSIMGADDPRRKLEELARG
jgi:indole-3-glycerol phosphate synthase